MNKLRIKDNPEKQIQVAMNKYLTLMGWYVMSTHGSMFQAGFPDTWATHSKYGGRWIEYKLPGMKGSRFTPAQLECFPKLAANGTAIYILTGATDEEYQKLFKPSNFSYYFHLSTFKTGH